jgi:hypothetical protein
MAFAELVRTNDLVTLSVFESLMQAAGIPVFILDAHQSVIDGSLGIIARRLMVDASDEAAARRLATEAGLGGELRPERR